MIKIISILALSITLYAHSVIEITQKQQNDLGVKTIKVKKASHSFYGPYNGKVVLDNKDIIYVSSNIESTIKAIYVRKLEHVTKGQKLITLKSNTLLNLQREYIQSLIESENIDQTYDRNKKLHAEGIISYKRLLESKKLKRSSDVKVKLNEHQLVSSGFTNRMLNQLASSHIPVVDKTIRASKSGIIYEIEVNVGENIQSEHNMMTIYSDGKRYIEIDVPVNIIEQISIGDYCTFGKYRAKINMIGNIVNSENQSIQIRAEIEKSDNIFINRVYSAKIIKSVDGLYRVKKSSLVFEEKISYLFKKVSNGFLPLNAEIINEDRDYYIVKANLNDGDELAYTSTSALLSAMDHKGE